MGKVAKIYNPLRLASPVTLSGEILYRDACGTRFAWESLLPCDLQAKWRKWKQGLPEHVNAPRNVMKHEGKILSIDLHTFGDSSGKGVPAATFAVADQPSATNQGLVTEKSRLAKKGLTIPHLELVAGHISTNLVLNVKEVLGGFPVGSVYGWLDSTLAVHWIRENGEYMQFVGYQVRKFQKNQINWRHVPTEENEADVGIRGGGVRISKPQDWPPDLVTTSTQETKPGKVKQTRELFALSIEKTENYDAFNELLEKHELWRVLPESRDSSTT